MGRGQDGSTKSLGSMPALNHHRSCLCGLPLIVMLGVSLHFGCLVECAISASSAPTWRATTLPVSLKLVSRTALKLRGGSDEASVVSIGTGEGDVLGDVWGITVEDAKARYGTDSLPMAKSRAFVEVVQEVCHLISPYCFPS